MLTPEQKQTVVELMEERPGLSPEEYFRIYWRRGGRSIRKSSFLQSVRMRRVAERRKTRERFEHLQRQLRLERKRSQAARANARRFSRAVDQASDVAKAFTAEQLQAATRLVQVFGNDVRRAKLYVDVVSETQLGS